MLVPEERYPTEFSIAAIPGMVICAGNGSTVKRIAIHRTSLHIADVGAVCDRAFFVDSAKNVRSWTAPTARVSFLMNLLAHAVKDVLKRWSWPRSEGLKNGRTEESGMTAYRG
jgi:hypothetical protein